MSLNRLMSKRHSKVLSKKNSKSITELYGEDPKRMTKDEFSQLAGIISKLHAMGIPEPNQERVKQFLRGKYANNDPEKVVQLYLDWEDATSGIIANIDCDVNLLGAENNGKVTCYLDSLLFALYARLDSFEPMLCNENLSVDAMNLSTRVRLFVNLMRNGKLVTADLMQQIQDALAQCGWKDAAKKEQQDVSEAFCFIAETLQMPLLTLKMDIAHGGKETPDDDHKFINERLLNVAIPSEVGPSGSITLEECLTEYFNNRVDVRRDLERQQSHNVAELCDYKDPSLFLDDKDATLHVEFSDLGSSPSTPLETHSPKTPTSRSFSFLRTVEREEKINKKNGLKRTISSVRKEIMIPAWQFFSILPFYTDTTESKGSKPTTKANFASQFASRRPIIGLCLKRYSWTEHNTPIRNGAEVKIPTEIDLPHFVGDEDIEKPGHFRLTLQSAVCHRGTSVNSGHYIALVRSENDTWLLFDDLANERVTMTDREEAFSRETPYLLFYQVEMIDEPPPYVYVEERSARTSLDTKRSNLSPTSSAEGLPSNEIDQSGKGPLKDITPSQPQTPSLELPNGLESVNAKLLERSYKIEPSRDTLRPSSRDERRASVPGSKTASRSVSRSGDNRLSFQLSRLTPKRTKDDLSEISDQENIDIADGNNQKASKIKKRAMSKVRGKQKEKTEDGKDKECRLM